MSDTPGLLSLYNLLARASNVSCSKGASAFFSLLTTEDDRLSLAIDGFIPALQNTDLQVCILVSNPVTELVAHSSAGGCPDTATHSCRLCS
jgi:hypothetical protein